MNKFIKLNFISFFLILIIFGLDRLTKTLITKKLEVENLIYINDYLNFDLVWNTGIGFGLLNSEANLFYHIITFVILIVISFLIYVSVQTESYEKLCYSLIIGGAVGNFFDRAIYYAVPDFIDFHIENFHWFTFNFADISITIGIILILVFEITKKDEK